ncbi:hypothetical protein AV654_19525 [Paenibacillus elgii]|uniref:Uncharacterized protein n=1 Tax=Paenibacillus elgii TaxID=189691 RepID=A0A163XN88_9BACL|nr:hypothetical protein [Paenibacillus elgii]KZE78168.1 hypothetical protein AV654_19525 [Paenibacillus elgii]
MDKNAQKFVKELISLSGEVVTLDPQDGGSKIDFLETKKSKISIEDILECNGELKPFEVVSKETDITLEQYQHAETIIRITQYKEKI